MFQFVVGIDLCERLPCPRRRSGTLGRMRICRGIITRVIAGVRSMEYRVHRREERKEDRRSIGQE